MLRTPTPTRPRNADDLLDARLVAQLSRLDIASKKVFSGKMKGERRSKRRGESVEFADHRPYVSGDDLRRLDWHILARLDRLFLKLFLEEEDLSLHLIVDASSSMDCGQPNKFLFAQRTAAALGFIGLHNLHRVACSVLAGASPDVAARVREGTLGEDETLPPMSTLRDVRGRRRVHDLARFLCAIEPAGGAGFAENARRIALSRRGRGVCVVISDFFFKDGYEDGLRFLLGRGYDVFAIQVLSPQETDPDIAGDLRLRDIEDADRAEVTISAPLLKRYKQNLAAYCDTLRTFCARREITLLTVRTDTPMDALILDTFRARGLLR